MKKLNLNAIRIDGGTQPRERIDMEAVADYAAAIDGGVELPAVIVFHDGAENWLADGFHRWHAHKQADKASIYADVRAGSLDDAKLFASGSNGAHGLRRTNEDKRRAVEMTVAVPACSDWSDTRVAAHCHVSVSFVSAIRRPEVAARQQEHRAASAEKKLRNRSPTTPSSGSAAAVVPTAEAAASPVEKESLKSAATEPESFGPSEEEIAEAQREQDAEMAALRLVIEADDKLAAAVAEVKRLTLMNGVLESRVEGLMNEKNALIAAAKSWQRKAEKAERALKEAA